MKKLLYIHHALTFGGGTKSFFEIYDIIKFNYEITVIVSKDAVEIIDYLQIQKIPFQTLTFIPFFPIYSGGNGIFSRAFFEFFFNNYSIKLELLNLLSTLKPDVIFLNSITLLNFAFWINRSYKVVVFDRETITNKFHRFFYTYLLNNYVDTIFFLSNNEMDYFRNLKINRLFLPELYNKSRIEYFSNKTKTLIPNKIRILFLGGNDSQKGLFTLLRSLSKIKNESFELRVFGKVNFSNYKKLLFKPWQWSKFLKDILIKKLLNKHKSKIRLLGFNHSIEDEIFNCSVLVFPSTKVHQSRPFIESGLLKTPVIITNFKRTSDIHINNFNCLTIKPNDYVRLSFLIEKYILNQNYPELLLLNNYDFNYYRSDFIYVEKILLRYL